MLVRTAMLFAAGLGTRLLPLTARTPKPLVRVAGKPLLEYPLERLVAYGAERIVVNTHHLAAQVEAHVAALACRDRIQLSHEPVLLETGGGIVQALPWLGATPFFSANSDAFWLDPAGSTPALERLARMFDPEHMDALLLLVEPARAVGFSGPADFGLTDAGQLTRGARRLIFSGLQLLHPRLFADRRAAVSSSTQPQPFSLRDIYARAQQPDGRLERMFGLVHEGAWVHVGAPGELEQAEHFMAQHALPDPGRLQ